MRRICCLVAGAEWPVCKAQRPLGKRGDPAESQQGSGDLAPSATKNQIGPQSLNAHGRRFFSTVLIEAPLGQHLVLAPCSSCWTSDLQKPSALFIGIPQGLKLMEQPQYQALPIAEPEGKEAVKHLTSVYKN